MGDKLVIVESPAKAQTIKKIIGKGFIVKSSIGHVRDLPVKTLGVDVEDSFKPKYVVVKGRKKVIDELKKAAGKCDGIYLAPDPDREGEAIAWHLKVLLEDKKNPKEFLRVQYNEITPRAVREAFKNPGSLNMNRVNAQQARRILDRIVGYTVSPMLWRRIHRGLSAGRVQSVALRLVCERETEILAFVPVEYWILGAKVRKRVAPLDPFPIKLLRINDEKADIKSREQAEAVRADLEGRSLKIVKIATKEMARRAPPPFITSTLQQAASSRYGSSPNRTMRMAQTLYEGIDLGGEHVGLITYMRTDSFRVSQDALQMSRAFIEQTYGAAYCPEKPNFYKSRNGAQEAHEAIRPTDVNRTVESLKGKLDAPELRLYKLIWERFVASQMSPAKIAQLSVRVNALSDNASADTYMFQASASNVIFPGYMKVVGMDAEKKQVDAGEVESLPPLSEGEQLDCLEWLSDRKETKPPARFSEASLVRALESNGVGRPSTYAQIMATLLHREYVVREKRTLTPTDLGMEVSALLVKTLPNLFDVAFTAGMENSLDEIEKGSVDWVRMLGAFYEQFKQWMDLAKEPPADKAQVATLLAALEHVREWPPAVKRGKRTYSDEKFVASIRKQLEEGKKDISKRQFEGLLRIACLYREQVQELASVIETLGRAEMFEQPAMQPPSETTMRKIALLQKVDLEDSTQQFIDSLQARVDGHRCLTDAQVGALNNVVVAHASQIENFEELKDALDVAESDVARDHESEPLINALKDVTVWKPPVTRGKRVFDDRKFFQSLCQHFDRKGFLSVRQRAALKKMVARYRGDISGYKELAEKFGLKQ